MGQGPHRPVLGPACGRGRRLGGGGWRHEQGFGRRLQTSHGCASRALTPLGEGLVGPSPGLMTAHSQLPVHVPTVLHPCHPRPEDGDWAVSQASLRQLGSSHTLSSIVPAVLQVPGHVAHLHALAGAICAWGPPNDTSASLPSEWAAQVPPVRLKCTLCPSRKVRKDADEPTCWVIPRPGLLGR